MERKVERYAITVDGKQYHVAQWEIGQVEDGDNGETWPLVKMETVANGKILQVEGRWGEILGGELVEKIRETVTN